MEFEKVIAQLNNKQDFINFIKVLMRDLKENPGEWQNNTLPDYLEAIANWTEDMEQYYINNKLPIPQSLDWKIFANILIAAKMYE